MSFAEDVYPFRVLSAREADEHLVGETVRGMVAVAAAKEQISEYLGIDVAKGANGLRWHDPVENRRMLAAYGDLITRHEGHTYVFKPEQVTRGGGPTSSQLDEQKAAEGSRFDEMPESKLDAFAVLNDLDGYPTVASVEDKRRYLRDWTMDLV